MFLPINPTPDPVQFGLWATGNIMKRCYMIIPEISRNETQHKTHANDEERRCSCTSRTIWNLSATTYHRGIRLVAQMVIVCLQCRRPGFIPCRGDGLEIEMVIRSSILAWRTLWTEAPAGLQSVGLQRVGQDWATNTFTCTIEGIDRSSDEEYHQLVGQPIGRTTFKMPG